MCLAYVYILSTFYLRVISFILIKPRVEEKLLHVHLKKLFDRNFCIEKKKTKRRIEKKNTCNSSFSFILYAARSSIALTIHRSINMGTNMDKPTQETEYLENKSPKSC